MLDKNRINEIYDEVRKQFDVACKNLSNLKKRMAMFEGAALSDAIPGWNEMKLDFGAYKEDEFAALFVDMRDSTKRAEYIGAENTFLTMYAYLPAMIIGVHDAKGKIVDIAGDGIMALWRKSDKTEHENVAQAAGICGENLMQIKDEVTNKILKETNLPPINIGVGVDYGKVVVTKIGWKDSVYDVKAFGSCINNASHLSKGVDEVRIGEDAANIWPSSVHGRINFICNHEGYYTLSRKDAFEV